LRIQIRMDPHYFEKLEPDPCPHYSEKLDADPHESKNLGVEAQNGAVEGRGRSQWRRGGWSFCRLAVADSHIRVRILVKSWIWIRNLVKSWIRTCSRL
jgi:hypothetical protein